MRLISAIASMVLLPALAACGDLRTGPLSDVHAITAQPAATSTASRNQTEVSAAPFKTVGRSFYQSTQCSPHSTTIEMTVGSQSLMLMYSEMVGSYTRYVLNLGQPHTIKQVVREDPETARGSIDAALLDPADSEQQSAYNQALGQIRAGVDKLRGGNLCFPPRPELAEISDYLTRM